MEKKKYTEVFKKLEIDIDDVGEKSIYNYSPVFKCKLKNEYAIVKKTRKPVSRAQKLAKWERHLKSRGVNIVSPIKRRLKKSITECNEEVWVIYPFIEGRQYDGSMQDIYEAGKLLGLMHELSQQNILSAKGFNWNIYDLEYRDEVTEDLEKIYEDIEDKEEKKQFEKLKNRMEALMESNYTGLKGLKLPYVDGCWDYKANNLVYKENGKPVLIDPDNAGRIPRIFDLALALILFHNEMETAPPRMFSVKEWDLFKEGYLEYVNITQEEKDIWNKYLLFVFADEATWSIMNFEEEKENERQYKFLKSLLKFDEMKYKL